MIPMIVTLADVKGGRSRHFTPGYARGPVAWEPWDIYAPLDDKMEILASLHLRRPDVTGDIAKAIVRNATVKDKRTARGRVAELTLKPPIPSHGAGFKPARRKAAEAIDKAIAKYLEDAA